MELMKHIEEERERHNNTDYKKALKSRKPRPVEIRGGKTEEDRDNTFIYASPFKSVLGGSTAAGMNICEGDTFQQAIEIIQSMNRPELPLKEGSPFVRQE